MPNYTYTCATCGSFTLRQSMNISHEVATCPTCHSTAKREFTAFQTYKMDANLKQRIEKGQNPRVVKKEALPSKRKTPTSTQRPWLAGHS